MLDFTYSVQGKAIDAQSSDHIEPDEQIRAIHKLIGENATALGAELRPDILSLIAEALINDYPKTLNIGEVTDATEVTSDTFCEPRLAQPSDPSKEEFQS